MRYGLHHGYVATRPSDVNNIGRYVVGASYRAVIIAGGNNDACASFSPAALRTAGSLDCGTGNAGSATGGARRPGPDSRSGLGYVSQRTIGPEEAARIGIPLIDDCAQGWLQG